MTKDFIEAARASIDSMWLPALLIVDTKSGQIVDARVILVDDSDSKQQALLALGGYSGKGFKDIEGSVALAYQAAGFVSGIASRLQGSCKLFFDGREQKNLKPYGRILQKVSQMADAFAENFEG